MRRYSSSIFCAFVLLCSACSDQQELASNLDTEQSIEIVVALKGVGISSNRERISTGRESRYTVSVSPSEYLRALQVMHEYRLPNEHSDQFNEVTAAQGLAPNSPEMNRLRIDRALSLEAERVLGGLPGILDVKAVVRSASSSQSGSVPEGTGPSVALVIRYLSPSGNVPFSVDEVKKLVMKTVPGTDPDSIMINTSRVFFPIAASAEGATGSDGQPNAAAYVQLRPFPFRVLPSERMKAYAQIGTLFLGATLAGIILGAAVVYSSKKQARRRRPPSSGNRGLMPEVVSRSLSPSAQAEYSEAIRRRPSDG